MFAFPFYHRTNSVRPEKIVSWPDKEKPHTEDSMCAEIYRILIFRLPPDLAP